MVDWSCKIDEFKEDQDLSFNSCFDELCSRSNELDKVFLNSRLESTPRPCIAGTQTAQHQHLDSKRGSITSPPVSPLLSMGAGFKSTTGENKNSFNESSGLGTSIEASGLNQTQEDSVSDSDKEKNFKSEINAYSTTESVLSYILKDSEFQGHQQQQQSRMPPVNGLMDDCRAKRCNNLNLNNTIGKYVEEVTGCNPTFFNNERKFHQQETTSHSSIMKQNNICSDSMMKQNMLRSQMQNYAQKPAMKNDLNGFKFDDAMHHNGNRQGHDRRFSKGHQDAMKQSPTNQQILECLMLLRQRENEQRNGLGLNDNSKIDCSQLLYGNIDLTSQLLASNQLNLMNYLNLGMYNKPNDVDLNLLGMQTNFNRKAMNPQKLLEDNIEQAASVYRSSAVGKNSDSGFLWSGQLPSRNYKSMEFSKKVFIGGIPWDATKDLMHQIFMEFGPLSVIWPQKDSSSSHFNRSSGPRGYCYLIFEHENSVAELLKCCFKDPMSGGDFYRIFHPNIMQKDVQVIPWIITDSKYSAELVYNYPQSWCVFIGALHGMITAEGLATIINDLFGHVISCSIDTDKYKYPIGSGRVIFSNRASYIKAVMTNFVHIKTKKFNKTIQIDPYLEDSICSKCNQNPGVYFCRSLECFDYFCTSCWARQHSNVSNLQSHNPLRRSVRNS